MTQGITFYLTPTINGCVRQSHLLTLQSYDFNGVFILAKAIKFF